MSSPTARQFNGTSDYLLSASAIDLSAITFMWISFWLWQDAYVAGDAAVIVTGSGSDNGSIYLSPDASDGSHWDLYFKQTGFNHYHMPQQPVAEWHHYAIRVSPFWGPTSNFAAHVDGAVETLEVASNGAESAAFASGLNMSVMS